MTHFYTSFLLFTSGLGRSRRGDLRPLVIALGSRYLARPSIRYTTWLMGIVWLLFGWGLAPATQAQDPTWTRQIGGSGNTVGNGIAVDGAGNVYTTGSFTGTSDFDPGAGVFNLTATGVSAIFVSKLDAAGNFVWARQMSGSGTNAGNSIAVDGTGNVITTGYFNQTTDFDPGAGVVNLTSAGGLDIFVSKLDAAGNFVWAKRIGETAPPPNQSAENADEGTAVTVDGAGNVYYTGEFRNEMDFDPGSGVVILRASDYFGVAASFVSKLDAAGNFVWAKAMKGGVRTDATGADAIGISQGYGVAVDGTGNVYTTGYYRNIVDFDPGAGTFNLISSTDARIPRGSPDVFVSKLDAAGNFVWAKGMGDTGDDQGQSIAIDGLGNIVTTGFFTGGQVSGTADFDPGPRVFTLTPQTGLYDNFVSKLDAAGNFVSARLLRDSYTDTGNSVVVNADYIYTTGTNGNTMSVRKVTNPGPLRVTASASPNPACLPVIVALSVTATGATSPYGYTWAAPAGITLSATSTSAVSASVDAGVSGAQTFTVTVASSDGISTSTSLVSLTVGTAPTFTTSNPAICQGQYVNLGNYVSSKSPNTGDLTYYTTQANALTAANALTSGLVGPINNPVTYYARYDAAGCFSIQPIAVTFKPASPAPPAQTQTGHSYTGGVASVTVAQNSESVILAVPGCDGTVAWSGPNNFISFNSTISAPTATTGSFTYSASCSSQTACYSGSSQATVTVIVAPTITLGTLGPICQGVTSLLIPYTATTGNPTAYTVLGMGISGNGSLSGSSGNLMASLTSGFTGSFSVMVKTSQGVLSGTVSGSVTVNPAPTVSINPSSTTLTNTSPMVSLTAVGTGTYRWSTGATTPVISVTTSGTYSVTLTSPTGCTASTRVPVVGSDLTITLNLPQANFGASGTAAVGNFVVNVFEVAGLPTSSGNVTITITAPVGYTLSFAPTLTNITVSGGGTVPVNNAQWTVTQNLTNRQLTLTMNSGAFISGGGESSLGFSLTRTTANSGSTANITVNVADDLTMSYDGNLANNVYARIITGL